MKFSFWVRLACVACASVTLGAAQGAFNDVPADHTNIAAITSLTEKGLLKGNPDGTFKPNASVNRAEFLTILLRLKNEDLSASAMGSCFSDVALKAWYAHAACLGKNHGIINGGPTGKFRAGDAVSLVEASKMLAVSQNALVELPSSTQEWYDPFLRYMEKRAAIPDSMGYVSQPLTRAEVAEIVWRVTEGKKDRPAIAASLLSKTPCTPMPSTLASSGADMRQVQSAWLGWYNSERSKVGAGNLVIVPELNKTAQAWAETAKKRGYIDHKRGTNTYYDYNLIKNWFAQQGVTFTGRGTNFGESIAWNVYSCSSDDCTDEMIDGIRSSFNFFAGEKGKAYRPHYDMMVNKGYKQIGLGVAVDKSAKKFYLVTHLAVGVAGGGLPYCAARAR